MENEKPDNPLHEAILKDIQQRSQWEYKQANWYRMRHTGIARKQKPWTNAADLHFPLIDTNIEKLKPLFFQQIVGNSDVAATFVPMKPQLQEATTTAERLFDFKIRERTNLQDEALSWIDWMLMSGRGVMKVTWSNKKKQVEYAAIDPVYVVVPEHTRDLQDADRIVHIMPMSVAAYKRAGLYKADADTVKKITGKGPDAASGSQQELVQLRQVREGLTHSDSQDMIIVWEVYERQEDGGWVIKTYSPVDPEIPLRDQMQLPYDHKMAPFVDCPYEVKDRGWYAPRGIAEILSPFEAALCHTWNQKHDSMQLFNKPMFQAQREVPNTMNLRASPGLVLPFGISPAAMPQPPMSFDQELTFARSIAEARVANPDYGMGQVLNTTNRRTATEIDSINAQSQQAGDLRARTFRMALGKLYKMTWSLYLQYDKEAMKYRYLNGAAEANPDAMHEEYHIEPKGGVNEVSKQQVMQRLFGYKQAFAQSPWIDQSVIDRQILAMGDPELVPLAFHDPNLKEQDEVTDEVKNIPALLAGGPIPVKQGQNYASRVGVLMQFLENARTQRQILPPQGFQRFAERLQALLQADMQVDNNQAKQLAKSVLTFLQSAGPALTGQPMLQQPPPVAA